MRFHNILEEIMGNKTKVKILRTMFEYSDKEFSEQDLHRFGEITQPSVHRNMDQLVNENIVKMRRVGKTNLFSLNKTYVLYGMLSNLFRNEKKLLEELEVQIRKVLENDEDVLAAVLFGSVAKGVERSDSDIDLLVVVDDHADIDRVNEKLEELNLVVGKRFGNSISYLTKTKCEFTEIKDKTLYYEIKNGRLVFSRRGFEW